MDKNKQTKKTDVHIEQVNPRTELNDLEKTAILQFRIDENELKEEQLSKTQQIKVLNDKKKLDNGMDLSIKTKVVEELVLPKTTDKKDTSMDFELPKKKKTDQVNLEFDMPKKVNSLTDTVRIKLSDLRAAIEKKEKESIKDNVTKHSEVKEPKKSLYDTIIIKLDDIINNRKSLRNFDYVKVVCVDEPLHINDKKKLRLKVRDITKAKKFNLNVDSEEFVSQIRNLNIIALNKLSSRRIGYIRDNRDYKVNRSFEGEKIPKEQYLAYKDALIEFAIDKLYYQYSLKETKRYKMYKVSVALSVLVFLVTSLVIFSWFIQGVTINNLSNSLNEAAPVVEVQDGTIINSEYVPEVPVEEDGTLDKETVRKNEMYWQYLNTPLSSVDFTELLKQNKDTVGWLIVNNTNINYPVVQTTNNDYYLSHAFDRSKNYAGWVFADFRNDFDSLSKNTVIYAHGRKDGVMFGSLTQTLKKNWYTNTKNQIIQFSTPKYNTMWQVFAVYKVEAESYYISTDFVTDEDFEEFIDVMKNRSVYDFGVDVTKDDKLLTLSTCYNDKGVRLVVQAKLVKIQNR